MSPRKPQPSEPDPQAELRAAVGLEPRIELGNDAAIKGQIRIDEALLTEEDNPELAKALSRVSDGFFKPGGVP